MLSKIVYSKSQSARPGIPYEAEHLVKLVAREIVTGELTTGFAGFSFVIAWVNSGEFYIHPCRCRSAAAKTISTVTAFSRPSATELDELK